MKCSALRDVELRNSLLVIGSGVNVVDMVGEIVYSYPNIALTVATKEEYLLPYCTKEVYVSLSFLSQRYLNKTNDRIVALMKEHNVKIISKWNHFRKSRKKSRRSFYTFEMANGPNIRVKADAVFWLENPHPNTEFLMGNFKFVLDEENYIRCNSKLQLPLCPNIFAAGSVLSYKEPSIIEIAWEQVRIISKNITQMSKGRIPKTKYTVPHTPLLFLPYIRE